MDRREFIALTAACLVAPNLTHANKRYYLRRGRNDKIACSFSMVLMLAESGALDGYELVSEEEYYIE